MTFCYTVAASQGERSGVQGGAEPLYVVKPSLAQVLMVQSTPLVSALNTITLTVESNFDLLASSGTEITVTGLKGATSPYATVCLICDVPWHNTTNNTVQHNTQDNDA